MNKNVLVQYMDLQKESEEIRKRIEKLEQQISRIEQEGTVVDRVKGGFGGKQTFRIEGFPYPEYNRKRQLLYARKATLCGLEEEIVEQLNQVESFIATIPDSHMRRLVTLRVVEELPWRAVARRLGGRNTEDSVRKAFDRFME